jgi:ubiquinone/menaquinone biosynthesis C-methylase UbiE
VNIELAIDFFLDLERLGPGDIEQSKKALQYIQFENNTPKIADIGCGTGAQSIFLAKETNFQIIAVDFLQPFLDELNRKANILKLDIKTIHASMDNLPFSEQTFDLIWSEGAIYNIGFNKGINYWKKYLKQNGYLAITEMSWLTDSRPNEVENYWQKMYSGIDTIENKLKQLENSGYKIIDNFILPKNCWNNYYEHIKNKNGTFLEKWKNKKEAVDFANEGIFEIEIYERFNKYYGYVFYIAQKI